MCVCVCFLGEFFCRSIAVFITKTPRNPVNTLFLFERIRMVYYCFFWKKLKNKWSQIYQESARSSAVAMGTLSNWLARSISSCYGLRWRYSQLYISQWIRFRHFNEYRWLDIHFFWCVHQDIHLLSYFLHCRQLLSIHLHQRTISLYQVHVWIVWIAEPQHVWWRCALDSLGKLRRRKAR